MNTAPEHLPDRWRRILLRVNTGEDWAVAARAEGCSKTYAKVIRGRIMHNPAAVKMLEAGHAALREKTLFTQEAAVKEIDTMIRAALGAKNPAYMAAANLLTLKCKIHGLVRDKIEVEVTDLKGALAEARTRVGWVFVIPRQESLPAPTGPTDARGMGADTDSGGPAGDGPEEDTPTR
jgi:hypothetical protein